MDLMKVPLSMAGCQVIVAMCKGYCIRTFYLGMTVLYGIYFSLTFVTILTSEYTQCEKHTDC